MLRRLFSISLAFALCCLIAPSSLAEERTVKAPKAGSAEAVVVAAFEAALANDFKAYLKTVHSKERSNPRQKEQLKRYSWKRFQKQAAWYLSSQSPVTFVIARQTGEGSKIRFFIQDQKKKDRMSVPIRLEKDGDGWGITANSL